MAAKVMNRTSSQPRLGCLAAVQAGQTSKAPVPAATETAPNQAATFPPQSVTTQGYWRTGAHALGLTRKQK